VVIEGSTSLASWKANLAFQPVIFEDRALDVRVHRGSYAAANDIYARVQGVIRTHLDTFGDRAKIHITGHSLGGSLATLVALMLIIRGGAPRQAMADVWTFGAPYVLCGGDALLARLGLPRSFVRGIAMGTDMVPRCFSCYYPQWARDMLDSAPGAFKVDTKQQPSFLEEEMFYSPMGDMFLLQAMHGSAHPLLPAGPGLYVLAGEGLYEELVARALVKEGEEGDADEEEWLDRRASPSRGGAWGEWADECVDDTDSLEAIADVTGGVSSSWGGNRGREVTTEGGAEVRDRGTESSAAAAAVATSIRTSPIAATNGSAKVALGPDAGQSGVAGVSVPPGGFESLGRAKAGTSSAVVSAGASGGGVSPGATSSTSGGMRSRRLNRLACLTQSDAALTASLLLGSVRSSHVKLLVMCL
jgi:hypothetical protein